MSDTPPPSGEVTARSILPLAIGLIVLALALVGWFGFQSFGQNLLSLFTSTGTTAQEKSNSPQEVVPESDTKNVATNQVAMVDLNRVARWVAEASSTYGGDKSYDYSPSRVLEGDTSKGVWVEGADGDGIGEWIQLTTDGPQVHVMKVRLGIGFNAVSPKGTSLWDTNSRPKTLLVEFSNGTTTTLNLTDTPDIQEFSVDSQGPVTSVRFTIQAITVGAKDDTHDVCIGYMDLMGTQDLFRYESTKAGRSRSHQKGLEKFQAILVRMGRLDVKEPSGNPTVDGYFGELTQTAVELFQQSHGLESTGNIDQATADALVANDDPPQAQVGVLDGPKDRLNIRSQPSVEGAILAKLNVNSPVGILGSVPRTSSSEKTWYQVKTPSGLIGYCVEQFLVIPPDVLGRIPVVVDE